MLVVAVGVKGWGLRWSNEEVRRWSWIWKVGGDAGDGLEGEGGVANGNETCFWNMHGQWNKKKGEGERAKMGDYERAGELEGAQREGCGGH